MGQSGQRPVNEWVDVIAACEVHDVRNDAKAGFERLVLSGSPSSADGRERLDILERTRPLYESVGFKPVYGYHYLRKD